MNVCPVLDGFMIKVLCLQRDNDYYHSMYVTLRSCLWYPCILNGLSEKKNSFLYHVMVVLLKNDIIIFRATILTIERWNTLQNVAIACGNN